MQCWPEKKCGEASKMAVQSLNGGISPDDAGTEMPLTYSIIEADICGNA